MIAALKQAIDKTDTSELHKFWAYFDSRHQRLKKPLSEDEQKTVKVELERLRSEDVLVLKHGEMEDYLPPGVSGVKGIVGLTTDRNWINGIPDESRRGLLGQGPPLLDPQDRGEDQGASVRQAPSCGRG